MLTVESQGKGTSCIDGASLLLASIQYILDKGSERGIVPKVLPPYADDAVLASLAYRQHLCTGSTH